MAQGLFIATREFWALLQKLHRMVVVKGEDLEAQLVRPQQQQQQEEEGERLQEGKELPKGGSHIQLHLFYQQGLESMVRALFPVLYLIDTQLLAWCVCLPGVEVKYEGIEASIALAPEAAAAAEASKCSSVAAQGESGAWVGGMVGAVRPKQHQEVPRSSRARAGKDEDRLAEGSWHAPPAVAASAAARCSPNKS